MDYVLQRTRTLVSKLGHTINFVKGKPIHVPPECHQEAVAMGAVAAGEPKDDDEDKPEVPLSETERATLILAAVEQVVKKGQRDDFTATGIPHSRVLSSIVGFNVDAVQRDTAWAKHQAGDKD